MANLTPRIHPRMQSSSSAQTGTAETYAKRLARIFPEKLGLDSTVHELEDHIFGKFLRVPKLLSPCGSRKKSRTCVRVQGLLPRGEKRGQADAPRNDGRPVQRSQPVLRAHRQSETAVGAILLKTLERDAESCDAREYGKILCRYSRSYFTAHARSHHPVCTNRGGKEFYWKARRRQGVVPPPATGPRGLRCRLTSFWIIWSPLLLQIVLEHRLHVQNLLDGSDSRRRDAGRHPLPRSKLAVSHGSNKALGRDPSASPAHLYICGHVKMAKDVAAVLVDMIAQHWSC
ncbi:hypothetical protein EDB81DRAFT_943793 [Dactylonectria macrodidyma]|uniref:Uncharacterized protein n=1 Tax=Dactylonectria macrodidyma TaxID=307937 RepID=A0A9P9FGG1_9HYPO|nr:hypothetical protein EDB81DRAFT_943793 [Dactylonectria macrodidyma]